LTHASQSQAARLGVAVALFAGLAGVAAAQQSAPATIRPLAYTRAVLPNGLVALFNEDHASPTVVVDVWYHIGSKDDKPGQSGMAHLCEHLMTEGSAHVDETQSLFYKSIGGTSVYSANTTEDITHYYASVPSNALETALWFESDRMAAPLARIDSAKVAASRAIIGREREQRVESPPFGRYHDATVATLFPEGHPYHTTALAPVADIANVTPADVRQACLPYYVPNNAIVSLSGDFNTKTARALVEHYFGGIPKGATPARASMNVPTLSSEKRLVLEDRRANQPVINFAWVGASFTSPDRLALNAIGSILTLPRFGRLSKLLVDDRKLATSVRGGNFDLEKSGIFELIVFPRPGASLTSIETLVDSVIGAIPTTPVTQRELDRFANYNADSAVVWLQTQFARADTLAHGQVFAGDPVVYAKQVNATRHIKPADVQRVARQYLNDKHIVFSLVPAGKLDLIAKPELPYVNVTPAAAARKAPTP
jgi:zinc protease